MRKLAPFEFYHIYNRGTEKRKIFLTKRDYDRFVELLYLCNSKEKVHLQIQKYSSKDIFNIPRNNTLIDINAYCLMPNHFHLLLHEKEESGISKFMQKLLTAYTMYFNKKYKRTGVLFQGKFKSAHIDNDNYLKYLIAYIHLNPIKIIEPDWKDIGVKNLSKAKKFLDDYPYSSFIDFTNKNRKENKIITKDSLPDYFENVTDFRKNMEDWLEYKENY